MYSNIGVQTFRLRSKEGGTLLNDASFPVTTLNIDTWYHFELTHSAGTFYFFQDGVLLSSVAGAIEFSDLTGNFDIGRLSTAGYINAYIDEFRLSTGVARHTSGFTVETIAYKRAGVDDEYTSTLLHFDGTDASTTFIDTVGSTNWISQTGGSGAAPCLATAQKVFGTASGYLETSAPGWSKVLKSELVAASTRFSVWHRDRFAVDFRIRPATLPAAGETKDIVGWFGTTGNISLSLKYVSAATFDVLIVGSGIGNATIAAAVPLVINTWYHFAFTKDSTTVTFYLDGVSKGSVNASAIYANQDSAAKYATYISLGNTISATLNRYVDEFRISNDTKRWSSDFTPDTEAYGSTVKSASIDFAASSSYTVSNNFVDEGESSTVNAVIVGGYLINVATPPAATVNALFEPAYTKDISETASINATFGPIGLVTPISEESSVNAAFTATYSVHMSASDLPPCPLPTLEGRCGYNAVLDSSYDLCSLSATTGALLDTDTLPIMTLSATAERSLSSSLSSKVVLPYLNSNSDPSLIATLSRSIALMTLSSSGYITGTNALTETMPFPFMYALSSNSRDFSTYVMEYTR